MILMLGVSAGELQLAAWQHTYMPLLSSSGAELHSPCRVVRFCAAPPSEAWESSQEPCGLEADLPAAPHTQSPGRAGGGARAVQLLREYPCFAYARNRSAEDCILKASAHCRKVKHLLSHTPTPSKSYMVTWWCVSNPA